MLKYLLALLLLSVSLFAQSSTCSLGFIPQCSDFQTITTSGTTVRVSSNGGLVVSFEYVISTGKAKPSTLSIVVKGCGSSGTCDTLDTYATVANTVRSVSPSKIYAYYEVTPTWTGGTGVSVKINTQMTTARLNIPGLKSDGSNGASVDGTFKAGTTTPTILDNTGVTFPDGTKQASAGASVQPPAGLVAWYRSTDLSLANGATVASWPDASGFGNTATQSTEANKPTFVTNVFGTTPAVRFDGIQQVINPANNVYFSQATGGAAYIIGRQNVMNSQPVIPLALNTTNWFMKFLDWPNVAQVGQYTGAGDTASGLIVPARLSLFGASYNVRAINYVAHGKTSTVASSTTTGNTQGGSIGNWGTSNYWDAIDVVEVLVFNHALNPSEVSQLQQYAAAKYGITTTETTRILTVGNSLTAGYKITDGGTYPNKLQQALSATTFVYNLGRGSATTADLNTNYATAFAPFYDSTKSKNVIVVMEVRNHICNGSADATTAYNALKTFAQSATATGFKVVAATMPTASGGCTAQQQTDIGTVNTQVKANAVSEGWAVAVVDWAADASLADNNSATYYQADHVHWTSAGASRAASLLVPVLNSIGVN